MGGPVTAGERRVEVTQQVRYYPREAFLYWLGMWGREWESQVLMRRFDQRARIYGLQPAPGDGYHGQELPR